MLEELVSLEDGQEVDRLVEEAQGRKIISQLIFHHTTHPLFTNICNTRICFSFSSEDLHFLDRVGQNLLGVGGAVEMLQIVKASLRKLEASSVQERLHLQIVLAILHLANPNPKQINKLANKLNIPLLGAQTPDEVASYLEALIRSGTSEEEKSGTVFFMGNTGHWVLSCRER